jgi:hypothetical protein
MRSLSPSEVRVLRTLLVDEYATDLEGDRASDVPRTTFQTVRRRALVSGWIKERYIPSPSAIGVSSVRIRLAQPFADRWREAVQSLRTDDTVLLWASSETLFSVEFYRERNTRSARSVPDGLFRQQWTVDPDVTSGGVPVYFDYEGAWSRWALESEPIAYPRAFSGRLRAQAGSVPATLRYRAEDLRSIVVRPFEYGSSPPPGCRGAKRDYRDGSADS